MTRTATVRWTNGPVLLRRVRMSAVPGAIGVDTMMLIPLLEILFTVADCVAVSSTSRISQVVAGFGEKRGKERRSVNVFLNWSSAIAFLTPGLGVNHVSFRRMSVKTSLSRRVRVRNPIRQMQTH